MSGRGPRAAHSLRRPGRAGGNGKGNFPIGLAAKLQTFTGYGGGELGGVDAGDDGGPLDRLAGDDRYPRFRLEPPAERPRVDAGDYNNIAVRRPPERDIPERDRPSPEPHQPPVAASLNGLRGERPARLRVTIDSPATGEGCGRPGNLRLNRRKVPIRHLDVRLVRPRLLEVEAETGGQRLTAELRRQAGNLESAALARAGPRRCRRRAPVIDLGISARPETIHSSGFVNDTRSAVAWTAIDAKPDSGVDGAGGVPPTRRGEGHAPRTAPRAAPGARVERERRLETRRGAGDRRVERPGASGGGIVRAAIGTIDQHAMEVLESSTPAARSSGAPPAGQSRRCRSKPRLGSRRRETHSPAGRGGRPAGSSRRPSARAGP